MREISRRRFLKFLGVGAAAILTPPAVWKTIRQINENINLDWLDNPEDYKFIVRRNEGLPSSNGGIANTPFLWEKENGEREPYIKHIKAIAGNARAYISDSLEKDALGQYNDNVLKQMADYGRQLQQNELGLQVDLIDGFTMRNTWNPVYFKNKVSSPYAAEGEYSFFKLDKYQDAYLRRAERIGKVLKKIPNLTLVTLGNELRPPKNPDGREIFMKWYDRMALEVKTLIPDIKIASGVADPRKINRKVEGLDVNTVHFYDFSTNFFGLNDYLAKSEVPIIGQEWGVPESIMGVNYHVDLDGDWLKFFRRILEVSSQIDLKKKIVRINLTGLGVWKIDAYKSDGFNFNTTNMPRTTGAIKRFNLILAEANTL